MFDIGFFELALIGVVLLIVMGPEKLPEVARQGAFFVRKIRGWVTDMKSEMDMKDDGSLSSFREATREIADLKASLSQMGQDVMTEVDAVSSGVNDTVASVKDSVASVEDDMSELDPESYFQKLINDDVEVSPIDDVVAGKPEEEIPEEQIEEAPKKKPKKAASKKVAKAATKAKPKPKTAAKKKATAASSKTSTSKKKSPKKASIAKKADS